MAGGPCANLKSAGEERDRVRERERETVGRPRAAASKQASKIERERESGGHRVSRGRYSLLQDPFSPYAGTGGPPDGSFQNLATGITEQRFRGGNIKDQL